MAAKRHFSSLELLETRQMMSANPSTLGPTGESDLPLSEQLVYLDFNGDKGVAYRGPVTVEGIDVPAFALPAKISGRRGPVVAAVLTAVKQAYKGTGVQFTTSAPRHGREFSTAFVGGDGSPFAAYGSFLGLGEDVDVGNKIHTDNAFVFSDNVIPVGSSAKRYAQKLAGAITHEIGHLLGVAHKHDDPSGGPLASVAAVAVGTVAGDLKMRLPFQTGQSFLMNNGYGNVGDGDHNGYGIDFYMQEGTPIVPIADGVVIDVNDYAGRRSDATPPAGMSTRDMGGTWVKIRHQGQTSTWVSAYLHLSSRSVNIGDRVIGGQTILGYSGHSGWTQGATGNHLHLHIRNSTDTVGVRPVPMYGVDVTTGGSSTVITDFVQGHTYRAIDLPAAGPANDNFANASWISSPSATITGSNVGATKEPGEPDHGAVPGGKSVWHTWIPLVSGRVTIDTSGSNYDTTLGVYTGWSVGSLNYVAGNDDYGGRTTSQVTFDAVAGNVYRIAVDGWRASSGNFTMHLNQSVITTPSPYPTAPSNLSWYRTQPGQIRLSWTNTSSSESGFRLQYGSGGNWYTFSTLGQGTTSVYINAGAGSTWPLRVVRFDLSGVDQASDPVTATF